VRHVAETGSTNADLAALARAGESPGLVLVADHQTAGRGRLGRTWTAPAGTALLASVLLGVPAGQPLHGATMAAGLAARSACERLTGTAPDLKWPNDLMHRDRKLAGILAESVAVDGQPTAVVVGMGLNLHRAPGLQPDAAVLDELGGAPVDRDRFLETWLQELSRYVGFWEGDSVRLGAEYRANLSTLGQQVRVDMMDGTQTGIAVAATDDGRLVVATAEGEITVSVGDVVHLRPAEPI